MIARCRRRRFLRSATILTAGLAGLPGLAPAQEDPGSGRGSRLLYVAVPGIRNYLEYGGHGVLVFDQENDHRFVRRIPAAGLDPESGAPVNVKGICANAGTGRLYVSTIRSLQCFDLANDALLWEKEYPGGCDRMSMTPDGSEIYLPSLEKEHWHVVDASTGEVLKRIVPESRAHNTIVSLDGREAYLAGLGSPILPVVDTASREIVRRIGPFSNNIRPFTVNRARSRVYVCLNELLGFEVGDLESGKKLHRIEVPGVEMGPVKRHGCPSHGVGLTPDEREVWVVDAFNQSIHVFDNTSDPPRHLESLRVKDEPGWITFSLDGRFAYPSTGDIIDTSTRRIIGELRDESNTAVQSEKMVEIHFTREGRPVRHGDQFGLGRKE